MTRATAQPRSGGLTLARYAEAKGLPVAFLSALGVRDLSLGGNAAVAIPYHDERGQETAVRFRCALVGADRFRWRHGSKAAPYGADRLATARKLGRLAIVEGESDTQTLWFQDEPALGLPGANAWRENRDAPLLDGIATIYVVVEPDKGGEAVLAWIAKSRIRDRVRLVRLVGCKDPSELYLRDPDAFRGAWARALGDAVPWTDAAQADAAQRRTLAWMACSDLARRPRILDDAVLAARALGVVGEDRLVRLTFLAVVSRLLDKIVSLVVKGPSAAGKSFTVAQVLALFPSSAFYVRSAMSERALAYSEEPLEHRILVIYEAAGLHGELASYLLRSLLSEGRLVYETVEKTAEGLRARTIEREGPTGLIVTTTAVDLHPENETRLFSVTATDTSDQTKRVMLAMAAPRGPDLDVTRWHALQDWLMLAEHRVAIPFAEQLATLVAPAAVRLRRDFGAVLALIRAHAVLHQATRERDGDGNIVATVEDYAVVREVVADLVADGVGATVSETVRDTVAAVVKLHAAKGAEPVSVKEVAAELKLDKSAASRRVSVAVERGFIRNEETKTGRPSRLVPGDPLPDGSPILPEASALRCTVAGEAGGVPSPGPPTDEEIEERAAIRQFEGHQSREDAERGAERERGGGAS